MAAFVSDGCDRAGGDPGRGEQLRQAGVCHFAGCLRLGKGTRQRFESGRPCQRLLGFEAASPLHPQGGANPANRDRDEETEQDQEREHQHRIVDWPHRNSLQSLPPA